MLQAGRHKCCGLGAYGCSLGAYGCSLGAYGCSLDRTDWVGEHGHKRERSRKRERQREIIRCVDTATCHPSNTTRGRKREREGHRERPAHMALVSTVLVSATRPVGAQKTKAPSELATSQTLAPNGSACTAQGRAGQACEARRGLSRGRVGSVVQRWCRGRRFRRGADCADCAEGAEGAEGA